MKTKHLTIGVMLLITFISFVSCQSVIEKVIPGKYEDPLKVDNPVLKRLGARAQIFRVNTKKTTVIKGRKGTKIIIPANSFVDESGKLVVGRVTVKLVEITKSSQIAGSSIPMEYDDAIFVSGGMIKFEARYKKKIVGVSKDKKIIGFITPAKNKDSDKYHCPY